MTDSIDAPIDEAPASRMVAARPAALHPRTRVRFPETSPPCVQCWALPPLRDGHPSREARCGADPWLS